MANWTCSNPACRATHAAPRHRQCPRCGAPLVRDVSAVTVVAPAGGVDVPRKPAGATGGRDAPTPAGRHVGRYPITGVLGVGGMGEVLEATDPIIGRSLALKIVRGHSDERTQGKFLAEGRITGQLEHPGIPPLHELGATDDGQAYFTMKRIEGRDLAAMLDVERALVRNPSASRRGSTSAPAAGQSLSAWLAIFTKVCEAVSFAHGRRVIHRDLKPANVMCGAYGEVLVMDWGLAKVLDVDAPEGALRQARSRPDAPGATQDGAILGTPAYMPPEQALGEIDQIDERADVYALGALLYEILTLQTPYGGDSSIAILSNVVDAPFVPPSQRAPEREVPWELEAVVTRAMAKDKADRYPSVAELAADVAAYVEGRRVGAARYGTRAALAQWARAHRHGLRAAAAALATVAVFGLVQLAQAVRAQRAHRTAVAAAREEVARARPDEVVASAAALVAAAPEDPARRGPPTPAEAENYARTLAALQALSSRYGALLALMNDDGPARAGQFAALCALGRLAMVAEEPVLAIHALEQAATLNVDPVAAQALVARAQAERIARAEWRRARTIELLARVRTGRIRTAEGLSGARIELASYRGRATIEILAGVLEPIIERLRATTQHTLLAVAEPNPEERAAGEAPIVDLAPAVDAWLRVQAPGGSPAGVDSAMVARLDAAADRVVRRDRQSRLEGVGRDRTLQEILAEAQGRELDRDGPHLPTLIKVVCEALGQSGDGTLPPALLARYCWAEWDELRAGPAGLALVRLRSVAPAAQGLLEELVGLHNRGHVRTHWLASGPWWKLVGDLIEDLSDATEPTAPGSARASEPRTLEALLTRAIARQVAGDVKGALADLDRAAEHHPRVARIWTVRGAIRHDQRDYTGALEDYGRALLLAPDDPGALANRGVTRLALGDAAGAVVDLDRAIALDPQVPEPWIGRSAARLRLGDAAAALTDAERGVALGPSLTSGWLNRGRAHHARRDHVRAIADFDRVLELDPRSVAAYIYRGRSHRDAGAIDRAMADLEHAVELDPHNAAAYFGRGLIKQDRHDLDGAIADFDRAVELDPSNAEHFILRGALHATRKDDAKARADYDRAIELDPTSALAWNNRGNLRKANGDLAGAIGDYDRAIALAPRYLLALQNRSVARLAGKDHAGALADADGGIALDRARWELHAVRGQALLGLGRAADALAAFKDARAVAPAAQHAQLDRAIQQLSAPR